MPNGFQIDVPGGGWSSANQGLSDIGSGIGQWARQRQALQMMERQRQNELQDQIYLATMKAKIEEQHNPFSRVKDNVALAASLDQIGQLTPELEDALLGGMPGFSPRSGFQPGEGFGAQQPFAPATINRVDQFLSPGMPRGTSLVPSKPFGQAQPFGANEYQAATLSASGRPKEWKLKTAEDKLSEIKLQDEIVVKENKARLVQDSALDTLNTIKEVEQGIGHFGVFGAFPSVPGQKRIKWEANINKLLAQKVLDILASLKEASKTGATGFGQLSNKELQVLQDSSTALKRTLSPEDAQDYLNQMKASMYKILGEQHDGATNGKSKGFSYLW